MMFTDEELEKFIEDYRIEGEDNQEIVKRIHLMFGGEYHEKDKMYYNHVSFKLCNDDELYFLYNSDTNEFALSHSYKIINRWKLKELVEKMNFLLEKDKEKRLKMKLKKIDKDFV